MGPLNWEPDFRILSVNREFPVETEPFVQERLAAIAERGHEVRVLGPVGDAALAPAVTRQGARMRHLRTGTGFVGLPVALCRGLVRDPWFVIRLLVRLRRMHGGAPRFWHDLRRLLPAAGYSADVVHVEWLNDAVHLVEVLDLFPGVKVVSSQGSDLRVAPNVSVWVRTRLPLLFDAVDGVHCVSRDLANIAESYGADPATTAVIRNSVDMSYFSTDAYARRRADSEEMRLISVGRLHWVKGYSYALHAVRALLDRGHDVRYTIVGSDDGDADALDVAIRDLGLQEHVLLAGQAGRHRVRALLANADAFLLPSISEGTSVALLEAMAMTLPVVASDVGGTSEVMHNSEHGLLVEARDPTAIADAVERLLADRQKARQMGERAANHVRETFEAQQAIDQLLAFYVQLIPSWRLVQRTSTPR